MKFVKLFETYKNDIRITCEEILLELKDIGYKYYIEIDNQSNDRDIESIYIEIQRKGVLPRWSKDSVLDYLDRIDDYLKTKGFLMNKFSNRLEYSSNADCYFVYRKYKRFSDKPIP